MDSSQKKIYRYLWLSVIFLAIVASLSACGDSYEQELATQRAQTWNDFAKDHGLEKITVEQAVQLTDRDIFRAMLLVKTGCPSAASQLVNPETHKERHGKTQVEVND